MSSGGSSDERQRPARFAELVADRFVLEALAGRGGMGEVYRALDRRTGRPVAIKIMRDHQAPLVARFEREARILAELDHPLIVRYVDHGASHTGEPFLAMEWLDGHDLASRLARERLGASDSIELARSVAEALAVLHERGIVHRDLKPSNVFLVEGRIDRVKLLDFGLSHFGDSTRMTTTGTILGTLDYMAPEQARGDDELDARVDVFALGCVLFECLTGERPFAADHPTAVLTKLLFEEAPRVADRWPGAPAELDALVASMLSKRPGDRPQGAGAVAAALRGDPPTPPRWTGSQPTLELRRPTALTDGERRMVAVILVSAAEGDRGPDAAAAPVARLELEAAAYGGVFERLVDGTGAVLLSGVAVATDLAGQAARCALALRRCAGGRRIRSRWGEARARAGWRWDRRSTRPRGCSPRRGRERRGARTRSSRWMRPPRGCSRRGSTCARPAARSCCTASARRPTCGRCSASPRRASAGCASCGCSKRCSSKARRRARRRRSS